MSQWDVTPDYEKKIQKASGRIISCELRLFGGRADRMASVKIYLFSEGELAVSRSMPRYEALKVMEVCKSNDMVYVQYRVLKTALNFRGFNRMERVSFGTSTN
ncbi:MAG: hypothetical protein ACI9Y1_001936 [Lentisphaeria bacterium]|jgi:hypothetical protein